MSSLTFSGDTVKTSIPKSLYRSIIRIQAEKDVDFEAACEIEESLDKSIFEQKYVSASEKERELLERIAKLGKDQISATDFKDISGINTLLSRLEQKELLLKPQRGKYSLFHPLFAEFLKRK